MKKLLVVLVLLGFVCPLMGKGKWKAGATNLYIHNKTNKVIKVWVWAALPNQSWELKPGEGGWFSSNPDIKVPSEFAEYQRLIGTPLMLIYEGKKYIFTDPNFPVRPNATLMMEIYDPNNVPGVHLKQPYRAGILPATP